MKRNSRKIVLALLMTLAGLAAGAQRYVGTMEVDGYVRKDVEVRLVRTAQGEVVMKMLHVKFARMMPVKVDVDIPGITVENSRLHGDGITPTSDGKPYEKFRVTKLDGAVDSQRIGFTCMMGERPVKFDGQRKK